MSDLMGPGEIKRALESTMTSRERARALLNRLHDMSDRATHKSDPSDLDLLTLAIEAAVREEREAIARLALSHVPTTIWFGKPTEENDRLQRDLVERNMRGFAAAIRTTTRGKSPKEQ